MDMVMRSPLDAWTATIGTGWSLRNVAKCSGLTRRDYIHIYIYIIVYIYILYIYIYHYISIYYIVDFLNYRCIYI